MGKYDDYILHQGRLVKPRNLRRGAVVQFVLYTALAIFGLWNFRALAFVQITIIAALPFTWLYCLWLYRKADKALKERR